jgi:glucan 1,3-beta-glucosidase
MSYREGHYFSLEDNKNSKEGQNNYKEIQISDYRKYGEKL